MHHSPKPTKSRISLALCVLPALFAAASCGSAGSEDATSQGAATEGRSSENGAGEQSTAAEEATATTTTDTEGQTRLVQTPIGEVEVPLSPQRIIALDEYAAMNLLAFNIEAMEVGGAYKSLISHEILADYDIPVLGQDDAFTVNLEAIAASKPDLIVVTAESAFVSATEALSDIAPTVVIPYPSPWRDVITATGQVFGQEDRAKQIITALEARISDIKATLGDEPLSLSIMGETYGTTFSISPLAPVSAIVSEAGFSRPAAQIDGTPAAGYEAIIPLSFELIGEHDADVVAVLQSVYYDASVVTEVETYQQLPAVLAGNDVQINGDMWFGNHPFAAFWVLEDLAAMANGDHTLVGTMSDARTRWAAYLELVG